ncbi:twin-arginine translocase TatA/TatE family subunit [Ahrensia sp. R2A130]|uniref:twin-arginine translocase TatA/TatE family subunit n=1 Tax=Ahrensia sp. R2A130 TaxID=744979 RepID=UPI0001E0E859|nr:twin-arginine translocase TatA/TatE family subunit [Ahrensia sp. R2A130]EFL90383.1 putative Sec-independent protein translocase protein TatA/E-like protein [Ahrensia sp. R2A130]
MGQIGIWQIAIVAVVVVLLFGRGKISAVMGDVAKGINSFKKGLKDEDTTTADALEEGKEKVIDAHAERTKSS